MTIQEYDEEIEQLKNQFNTIKMELDSKFLRVQEESIKFFKERVQHIIEDSISSNPEITNNLDLDSLKEIKSIMNDTINQADVNIPIVFDKLKVAYHNYMEVVQEGDTVGQEYNIPKIIDSRITDAFRKLLSPIGTILIKYKYAKLGGEWKSNDSTNNQIEYGYGLYMGKELSNIIQEYSNQCTKAFKILVHIYQFTKDKETQRAKDIWNQI